MDLLPLHLVDEILFRLDLKSLAMMQCTGRSLRSHISTDQYFISEYFSRVESGLLYLTRWSSKTLFSYPFGDTKSLLRNKDRLFNLFQNKKDRLEIGSQILASCSGLLLLYVDGLCVANPLTKRFRFLDHSTSELFPGIVRRPGLESHRIGFAVDQVDRTTQRFKIVCINSEVKKYRFEINAGDDSGWRLSRNTITCPSSDLMTLMNPVYFDRALHWLREDGSIIAFNPETEKAQLIPIKFPDKRTWETIMLFTAADTKLTLVTATEEVIYVYALQNILIDPKWVLVRRIVMEKKEQPYTVVAFDEKRLVLYGKNGYFDAVVHRYDLKAKEWRAMGSLPWCHDTNQDFYQFKPSLSSVIHLDDEKVVACDNNKRFSSLMTIMRIIGGNSPHISFAAIREEENKLKMDCVENQLKKLRVK